MLLANPEYNMRMTPQNKSEITEELYIMASCENLQVAKLEKA